MKKSSLIFLFGILWGGFNTSFAQQKLHNGRPMRFEDLRKRTVVKFSPFHFFDRSIQLHSEFFNAGYKTSFLAGFTGTYRDDKAVSDQGASVEVQFRRYPRGFQADTAGWAQNSASGFYFGLSVSAGANVYKSKSEYYNLTGYGYSSTTANSHWVTPAVLLGYQVIIWESMYLDFYAGGGIKVNNVKKSSSDPSVDPELVMNNGSIFSRYYKGILPKLGFTIGVGL